MEKNVSTPLRGWLFLALIVAASVLPAAGTQAAAPVAAVPETVYQFPDIVAGETVVHDFVVQNLGDTVLNVLKVKTT